MNLCKTQCCAYQEIDGLRFHSSAKEAMISFCKWVFVGKVTFGGSPARKDTIYSFYLFSQANGRNDNRKYGDDFAAFIKANKLGPVYSSPKRVNVAFHPERSNQLYIWMPDTTALKAWWENVQNPPQGD